MQLLIFMNMEMIFEVLYQEFLEYMIDCRFCKNIFAIKIVEENSS